MSTKLSCRAKEGTLILFSSSERKRERERRKEGWGCRASEMKRSWAGWGAGPGTLPGVTMAADSCKNDAIYVPFEKACILVV